MRPANRNKQIDVAAQFQQAGKLENMIWVLPTAPENRDAMTTAWYGQTKLTVRPAPRPELEDDEDEDGILQSVVYICNIVDDLVSKGVAMNRIFLAGFSQGCAMSLIIGLASKYAGRFAGIVGLMGYLPLHARISALRTEYAQDADVSAQPVFIGRGTRDQLIPSRYFQMCREKLEELHVKDTTFIEYPIGHSISGPVLHDMCAFMERTLGIAGPKAE